MAARRRLRLLVLQKAIRSRFPNRFWPGMPGHLHRQSGTCDPFREVVTGLFGAGASSVRNMFQRASGWNRTVFSTAL